MQDVNSTISDLAVSVLVVEEMFLFFLSQRPLLFLLRNVEHCVTSHDSLNSPAVSLFEQSLIIRKKKQNIKAPENRILK